MYLRNEKLYLRAPEPEDLDLVYEWENDTSLWEVGETFAPISRFILKKYIDQSHLDIFQTQQVRFMISLQEHRSPAIGSVDLFDFDPFHLRAGIGILIDRRHRNKGYAHTALKLTIEYAQHVLGLQQLYCHIGTQNHPSLKLFKAAGFEINGLKKGWMKQGQSWSDVHFLQKILR